MSSDLPQKLRVTEIEVDELEFRLLVLSHNSSALSSTRRKALAAAKALRTLSIAISSDVHCQRNAGTCDAMQCEWHEAADVVKQVKS